MELAALERLRNRRHHFVSVAIDPILFKLAGNEDMHNILDEFEFRPDLTTDYGVSCPWASEKIPIDLLWEKQSHHVFSAVFDRILFILAGNEDIHKSLYEFEFRTDPTTDYGVSCPWASKKSMSSCNLRWYWSDLFSNLLVTRTCIILWMSSNFGQIGPPTTELAALERLRNTPIDL